MMTPVIFYSPLEYRAIFLTTKNWSLHCRIHIQTPSPPHIATPTHNFIFHVIPIKQNKTKKQIGYAPPCTSLDGRQGSARADDYLSQEMKNYV